MCHIERGWQDVDWIYLAEDIDRWQVLVNILMNFRFHKIQISLLADKLPAFQEGHRPMELIN